MSFLNAVFAYLLLGLTPVLIHLLNRQRFKKVDFPTLRFLRELQRQKMRQIKFRQILLLILRTLAVVFIVLALLRPVLKSSAGFLPGADARTTAVLILDRSASMQAETAAGSRFRQLQIRVQEILGLLRDGDEAQIIWADETPVVFPGSPTAQTPLLREAAAGEKPSQHGGNVVKALQRARHILGQSQNLHKEVYLLSDFSLSAWPEQMPEGSLLPDDVRVYLVPLGESVSRNTGVVDAAITSRIITLGRPVELTCTVRNTGANPANDRIVSAYVGGRRVAQTRMTLATDEAKTLRLRFVPDAPGDQVGSVRIEEADDFAADDQRFFVLRVPARLRVAVAGADGPARDLTALALNPTSDPGSAVGVSVMTAPELESLIWSDLDAIILVDASGFGSGLASRLRAYVEGGKGVLFMPGPQADLRAYQPALLTLGLPTLGEVWQDPASPIQWTNIDVNHPLFEGLFEEKPGGISPDLTRLVRITSIGTAVEIVGTPTGSPFLVESRVGRGRAFLMTGSPDPSWSTMYRSGIFPPLMVSSVAYLSGIGTSGSEFQLTAGIPAELLFSGSPGDERFELRGADRMLSPTVESAPIGFRLKIDALEEVGAYDLWRGSQRLAALAVNVPRRESDISPLQENRYRQVIGGHVTFLGERADFQAAILEGRFGRELWKLCLMFALALLLAEMLVGRVGKREAVSAT